MPFILPLVFKAMECFPSDKATESMWNVLYNGEGNRLYNDEWYWWRTLYLPPPLPLTEIAADVKDPLDVRLSLLRHFNVMVDKVGPSF